MARKKITEAPPKEEITAVEIAHGVLCYSTPRNKDHYQWRKETLITIIKQVYERPIVEWFDYLKGLCPRDWLKEVYEVILLQVEPLRPQIEEAHGDERIKKLVTTLFLVGIKEHILLDPEVFNWWWDLVDERAKEKFFKWHYYQEQAPKENIDKMLHAWNPMKSLSDRTLLFRVLELCLNERDLEEKGRIIISIFDQDMRYDGEDEVDTYDQFHDYDYEIDRDYISHYDLDHKFPPLRSKFVETYGETIS